MKSKWNTRFWIVTIVWAGCVQVFAEPFAKGPYLGQAPPGSTPKVFAPGLICDTRPETWESHGTFSMDGKVFLYLREMSYYLTENTDESWTKPIRLTGFEGELMWTPKFSPDGNSIYYSNKSLMKIDRTPQGWTAPKNLGSPLSSSANEWGLSVAADNSIYFCSHREGGRGGCDIWFAPYRDGVWSQAYNIEAVNTSNGECSPGIAPDESFMVFHSNRPGGLGKTDLYLTLHNPDGSWSPPRNLGPNINSTDLDCGAYISPDKKFLFFTRCTGWDPRIHTADIYWVELKEYLPESYR